MVNIYNICYKLCVKDCQCQIVSHFDICEGTPMPNSGCVRFAAAYSHTVLTQGSSTRPVCASSTHTVLTRSSPQRSHHKRSKWPTVRPTTVSPRLCTCSDGPTIAQVVQPLLRWSNHWLGDYLLRWSGGWVPWQERVLCACRLRREERRVVLVRTYRVAFG